MKKNKIALITGITGQDGSYLAEFLLSKHYIVHGIKRRSSSLNTKRIDHLFKDPQEKKVKLFLHYGDMTDSTNILKIIQKIKPDEIYNLAAQSHVQVSFESPEYTANADALGTLRILEAIKILRLNKKTKFYQASTSEMYGNSDQFPLNELSKFEPVNPYGVAKLYGYWITKLYREAYGIFASNGILFNHESPRRGENFVTKKIVSSVVNIKNQKQKILYLGNLNSKRDWGHAKDYVEGMWYMLQMKKPDDYVLSTGKSHSVRELVELAFKYVGITIIWKGSGINEVGVDKLNNKILIKIDKRYLRPNEIHNLLGDSTKAQRHFKWKIKYKFKDLVKEMIDEELKKYEKL
tara:strand:+ start:233 stop:1282 length:1050 start_codon:yes stop_codon:yes gene_type:complete